MILYSDIKMVGERIVDEESRDVFNMRLSYALGNSDMFDFFELVKDQKCVLYQSFYNWLKETSDKKYLIVFGAGRVGRYTIDIIKNNLIDIEACVDTNVSESSSYNGVKIIPFDRISEIKDNCKVVIGSANYRFQMLEQLLRNGFGMNQIWFPPFEILRGYVGTQYFDYFKPMKEEIIVDGGAYDGMTTVDFFKWTNGLKGKSYMFEANPKNESMIKNKMTTNNISNYELIAKGLYDKDGEICFATQDGPGAKITDGGERIKVTSIDDTLFDSAEKITLIKMDIEGAEGRAIEGAKKIIKRDSPRLAISVYHKPNDFVEIPLQLLEIHDDYRFAYRHYCTMSEETVLYAWRE